MQFTILAHIIHLLFPLLIGAHVYVNAICLLLTWAHIIVYISFVLVFVCLLWTKCKELDKMDLDFRILPKLMEFEEQLGLMPLECLKLEDEHWKDQILNSPCSFLVCFHRTFWCVFSCARDSNLSLIEEPLPWASKRERSKIHWGIFPRVHLTVDCLSLCLCDCLFQRMRATWIINMISREELHCGFVSYSLPLACLGL